MKGISPPYVIKTPQLCKMLKRTRQTLWRWEKQGFFTPPRNAHGDRIFTKKQAKEIKEAFAPGGAKQWHFKG